MYHIYNETGRAIKLNIASNDDNKSHQFQISVADSTGDFGVYHDIVTITDNDLVKVMNEFCQKCTNVVSKVSRFFFRCPNNKIVSYNTFKHTVVTFNKEIIKVEPIARTEQEEKYLKNPRNCLIFVLNKNSTIKYNPKLLIGRSPAMVSSITDDDYVIIVMYVNINNWAKVKNTHYIYVDGVDGKVQLKLTYVKSGPNKEYTSNSLKEEKFEGDEFPEFDDVKPIRHKSDNGDKPHYNKTTNYNNRNNNNRHYVQDKDRNYDKLYNESNHGKNKKGNPRRNKKHKNRAQ